MKEIHTRYGVGYSVWATEAEIRHWGGVVVVSREESGWQVEGIVNFVPTMISFFNVKFADMVPRQGIRSP